jgi:hypothetical protein
MCLPFRGYVSTTRLLSSGARQRLGCRHVRARHHVLAGTGVRDAEGYRTMFARPAVTIV